MRLFIALGIGALAACSSGDSTIGHDDTDEHVMPSDASSGDTGDSADGSSAPDGADGGSDADMMPPDRSSDDGGDLDGGDLDGGDLDGGDLDGGDLDGGDLDGGDGDDPDAGPLYPAGRLFVSMESSAPAVWDDASSITTDTPPTFTLSDASLASGTRGIVLANKRLFIGTPETSAAIVAFDAADVLESATPPAAKIPTSQLVPASTSYWSSWSPDSLTWDARSDSLWVGNQIGIELFTDARSLSSSSSAQALFTHEWHQLPGFAYDSLGDRLFLGQISGAGLLAYDSASHASGTPTHSFVVSPSTPAWSLTVDRGRLYAFIPENSMNDAQIAVWKGVADISAAKAPDFTMGWDSGLWGFADYVTVNGDVLIACMQSGKVHLWAQASALSGETMATQTITLPAGTSARKARLGPVSGRLYVLDDEGIAIYATPTTAPTLVAKITSGMAKPVDFVVLE